MTDDAELLRRFARERDEAAFAELVRRHVNLVHSAALRQLNGDAHLAKDATQLVFTDLARKAATVAGERVLAAWLLVSTRYAASKLVRSAQRRQAREQEAHLMQQLSSDPAAQLDWDKVRPVLDEALGELNEHDRAAILLRFFENRAFAEIGARLEMNENAARMRVERALDKLHSLLTRRGVTSTTAALAGALTQQAVVAAPAGLAVSVTGAALGGAAAGATAGGVGFYMSLTKLQIGIAGVIATAAVTGYTVEQREAASLHHEIASLQGQLTATPRRNAALPGADSRPSKSTPGGTDAELARLSAEAAALEAEWKAPASNQSASGVNGAGQSSRLGLEIEERRSLDQAPVASHRVPPKYPDEMRKLGVTGSVLVEFVVDAHGKVQQANAVKSSRPEFEAAAVEAVSQWVFQPGLKGGRSVNTRTQQVITFSLGSNATITPANWF